MTSYTAIPGTDIDAGSPATESLFTLLRDNPIAITEGASGAPGLQTAAYDASSVDQAALAADSVGQSEVKTSSQALTSGTAVNGGVSAAATGGTYSMGFQAKISTVAQNGLITEAGFFADTSTSYNYQLRMEYTADAGTRTGSVQGFYINASPPYDLGDGDIQQFVYGIVDNATGNLEDTSISRDPIWVYNGPTKVTPFRRTKDGKVYRRIRDVSGLPLTFTAAKAVGGGAIRDYIQAFIDAPFVLEQITAALKNADMDLIPHPFLHRDLTGKTPVLLDPVSPIMEQIKELARHEEADVGIIVRDYMTIGNTNLNRAGPAGLMIPSVAWKLT